MAGPKPDPFEIDTQKSATEAAGGLPLVGSRGRGVVPFGRGRPRRDTSVFQPPQEESLPMRYEVRETEEGRFLRCKEAPALAVSIDSGHVFSENEARRLGERVILLDGAGQFAPTVDDGANLYNLDHHEGCLRAFTLATCEQALVLVLKGLELNKGGWTIYANEPDLDTIFAIWVLLNYRRVRELGPEARDRLMPLLRLEGAIDANGYEIADFCGLTQGELSAARARLDVLFAHERQIKGAGGWEELDFAEFVVKQLSAIDHLIYEQKDFDDFESVERELGHVEIGDEKVAVLCSDEAGIYEVEQRLKKTWGDRLGIIALAKDERHYTLRRSASLAGIDLRDAYAKLNLLDPRVDGRPPEKRWGGSDEIGGSPRPGGTGLEPSQIAKVLRRTYQPPKRGEQIQNVGVVALWTAFITALACIAGLLWRNFQAVPGTPPSSPVELILAAAVLVLGAVAATLGLANGRTYVFGWRRPAGHRDWWLGASVVALGLSGAAWVPRGLDPAGRPLLTLVLLSCVAVALELWFRGLIHGRLLLEAPVQRVGGRWFLSRATVVSAVLYSLLTAAAFLLVLEPSPLASRVSWLVLSSGLQGSLPSLAVAAAGALVSGLVLGVLRERTLSLWPGVVAQLLAASAGLVASFLLAA